MREAVVNFGEAMEEKLVANDYKGGWSPQQCSLEFLTGKLLEEVGEFLKDKDPGELPDIANMAMMLWQRLSESGGVYR